MHGTDREQTLKFQIQFPIIKTRSILRYKELPSSSLTNWSYLFSFLQRKPPSVPVTYPPTSHPKPPLSPSQYNAPVPSSMCAEAKAMLDRVQSSRACLEANLEAVIRTKEQEEFYNYLDSLHLEG